MAGHRWRLSGARKRFVEKKVVEWGFPAAITALGYFLARATGLYDPATFAVLGPLSTIAAAKAVSTFTKGVQVAGEFGSSRIVADIDASARERQLRRLLQQRERLLTNRDLPTIGVPISGTNTALDGGEFTMPVDMLEQLYETVSVQAERKAEANLTPMRRRELARARFTLDHNHQDSLIDQFRHFRYRPEIERKRALAVTSVFDSEVDAVAAQLVQETIVEMALYEGREMRIDEAVLGVSRGDEWGQTPEWFKEAQLGPSVRPLIYPVDEAELAAAQEEPELVEKLIGDIAAAQERELVEEESWTTSRDVG